jgi:hypothetical protein
MPRRREYTRPQEILAVLTAMRKASVASTDAGYWEAEGPRKKLESAQKSERHHWARLFYLLFGRVPTEEEVQFAMGYHADPGDPYRVEFYAAEEPKR